MTEQTTAPPMEVQAVEAYLDNDMPLAQEMLDESLRNIGEGPPSDDPMRMPPMADAPKVAATEADMVVAKLNEMGGEHAAYIQQLEREGANPSEEMAYAHEAVKFIAPSHPDFIELLDTEFEMQDGRIIQLGSHPVMLKLASRFGRLNADFLGDFTVAQRYAPSDEPSRRVVTHGGGKKAAQEELDQIMADTPPGSVEYRTARVQRRVSELSRMIGGDEPIVGSGGRTA